MRFISAKIDYLRNVNSFFSQPNSLVRRDREHRRLQADVRQRGRPQTHHRQSPAETSDLGVSEFAPPKLPFWSQRQSSGLKLDLSLAHLAP